MKTFGALAGRRLPAHLTARLASWGAQPGALVWQPAPPVTGDLAIARRLANGILLFEGRLVETRERLPWELEAPDQVWQDELHGHGWLDHAAAAQDSAIWDHLAAWVWDWIARFGTGDGPGWEPELVARRLTRWIAHSVRLLNAQNAERSELFFQSLGMQARYLDWRWRETRDGAERIEALCGLVYAQLSLEGSGKAAQRAIVDLGREARRIVGADGTIASRSPEELARILALLVWARGSIEDAGLKPAKDHEQVIRQAIPVVRALRHPSGDLARFHGGRPGIGLPLEALTAADTAMPLPEGPVMGYRHMTQGESLVIADTAPPPGQGYRGSAHASALAFEFSHSGQPVVVNCGPGAGFGVKAAITSRRGPAHSTVELGGRCPARVVAGKGRHNTAILTAEGAVSARTSLDASGAWIMAASTLYESWFGLTVERRLHLRKDGLKLSGEDTALATRAETRAQIAAAFPDPGAPCPLITRFHLHPEVKASLALNGRAVALRLPDGSQWMMTSDADELRLEPSRYFDETRPKPRATSQIVAASHVMEYWGRVTWSLERLPHGTSPLKARTESGF